MKRVALLMFAIAVIPAASQMPTQKPQFEVVSLKPNRDGIRGSTMLGRRGDIVQGTNVPLRMLLLFAYVPPDGSFLNYQLIGGPDWMDGLDRFDVQAKLGSNPESVSPAEVQLTVQSLLQDRFQLKLHRETWELPLYNLVVAKNGKIQRSADQTPPDLPGKPSLILNPSMPLTRGTVKVTQRLTAAASTKTTFSASAVPIAALISRLQSNVGRLVNDKTGLKGFLTSGWNLFQIS